MTISCCYNNTCLYSVCTHEASRVTFVFVCRTELVWVISAPHAMRKVSTAGLIDALFAFTSNGLSPN